MFSRMIYELGNDRSNSGDGGGGGDGGGVVVVVTTKNVRKGLSNCHLRVNYD